MRFLRSHSARLLFASILCLVFVADALAQVRPREQTRDRQAPLLYVDHAVFKAEGQLSRLEVYYQFYNFGLTFLDTNGRYEANYRAEVIVRGRGGIQTAADERRRTITIEDPTRVSSHYDFRTSQFNFDLEPGNYEVEFSLYDEYSSMVTTRDFKVKLSEFESSKPLMSSVQFIQASTMAGANRGPFDKGNLRLIPSVTRSFGGGDSARLVYYLEIYPGSDRQDAVIVETRLRHFADGLVYRDTVHTDLASPIVRQLRSINLDTFSPGQYELDIWLRGRRMKKLDHQRHEFTVLWTQEGLLARDWDNELRRLGYISLPGELDPLKEASDLEERREMFDDFWAAKDPTPGTPENEWKREFYRRVNTANQRYSHGRTEGWKTHRGEKYIQLGEPDFIRDVPYSLSGPPYQIWEYYRYGEYLQFTFVDEFEDGDYRLQWPYDGRNQSPIFEP